MTDTGGDPVLLVLGRQTWSADRGSVCLRGSPAFFSRLLLSDDSSPRSVGKRTAPAWYHHLLEYILWVSLFRFLRNREYSWSLTSKCIGSPWAFRICPVICWLAHVRLPRPLVGAGLQGGAVVWESTPKHASRGYIQQLFHRLIR